MLCDDSHVVAPHDGINMMFANTNAYFYRHRPPNERQRRGPFTEEEEEVFMRRLRYFRDELHISNGAWGFFAVPLTGRVGYQCSSFYRKLLKNGKIKAGNDEGNRSRVPETAIERLRLESAKWIRAHFSDSELEKPIVRSEAAPVVSERVTTPPPAARPPPVAPARAEKARNPEEVQEKGEAMSDLKYARDSVTGRPMLCPCMDVKSGLVLDRSTWMRVFRGDVTVPTYASGIGDLVVMTQRNFQKYWMDIVNVSF